LFYQYKRTNTDSSGAAEDDTPTTTKRACGKHIAQNNASQMMMEVVMESDAAVALDYGDAATLAILSSMKSAGSEVRQVSVFVLSLLALLLQKFKY